ASACTCGTLCPIIFALQAVPSRSLPIPNPPRAPGAGRVHAPSADRHLGRRPVHSDCAGPVVARPLLPTVHVRQLRPATLPGRGQSARRPLHPPGCPGREQHAPPDGAPVVDDAATTGSCGDSCSASGSGGGSAAATGSPARGSSICPAWPAPACCTSPPTESSVLRPGRTTSAATSAATPTSPPPISSSRPAPPAARVWLAA